MNAAVRLAAWILAIVLVVLPIVAVMNGWFAADRWPVKRLLLSAEYQRVNAEQVRAALAPQLGAGFFAIDLQRVHDTLAALPWVRTVEVRKRWPDLLEVTLTEHRAHARLADGKLLSDRGEVFAAAAADDMQGLPVYDVPLARLAEVVAFHDRSGEHFSGTGLLVQQIHLTARGSWTLRLSNGAEVVLGRGEPDARLLRFSRVLPQLNDGRRLLRRADLRYANGFALRWQDHETGAVDGAAVDTPATPSESMIQDA